MEMKYALFLGCTIPVRGRNYEFSARAVAAALGIELVEVLDFACCGFPVKSADEETALLVAARNLAIAEKSGLTICTLCSACTSMLTETNNKLTESHNLKREVNRKLIEIGLSLKIGVKVRHFARILYEEIGIAKIRDLVERDLSKVRLAAHYGCHYLRPKEIYGGFDASENPKSLGELIEATGASLVKYEKESFCCGGAILGVDKDISLAMAGEKLNNVRRQGADGLVTICPFCSVMYDDNQIKAGEKFGVEFELPILYYPQVLGLALGLAPKELGFRMNKIRANKLFAEIGISM
jgi:heterodisulfide reductase subunit B